MSGPPATRPPWYLWPVGIIALLWNGFGCYDFLMKVSHNESYVAALPPGMIEYLDAYPGWAFGAWIVGVWGALAGAVLLLMRRRAAVGIFAASLGGLLLETGYDWSRPMPPVASPSASTTVLTGVVWIIAIALLGFSAQMRSRGVLR